MSSPKIFIGIDIGGTWLKGLVFKHDPAKSSSLDLENVANAVINTQVHRVLSRLGESAAAEDFMDAVNELVSQLAQEGETVSGIGISTPGIVNYAGEKIEIAGTHLNALKSPEWKKQLEQYYNAPVSLINDADATAIGAAATGYLQGPRTIGVMPIGTGVGFTLWRNGRRWNPHRTLPLLGSVMTPSGSYDQLAGVSEIAKLAGHDLSAIFTNPEFEEVREKYESALANVVYTSSIVYHTDTVLIGGGLAEAISGCGYPLTENLRRRIEASLAFLGRHTEIKIMPQGNYLPLIGASLLAMGEHTAQANKSGKKYEQINTEIPFDKDIRLQEMPSADIVKLLWETEQEAGKQLRKSLPDIATAANIIAERLEKGGRLIYVGAGTSGRLASIDNVELSCTFGFPKEKVYTLISGGLPDAAIDIESDFEEDASGVPEMLLTGINENDAVIGISVSGTAYFVQSSLALARSFGAYTIFIQESANVETPFADMNILLNSGHEVIAGSTRMKAGTATKKVINFLSTTAMIMLGKVHGPYMVDMECVNEKLISRAKSILNVLFGYDEKEAEKLLSENNFDLRKTVTRITSRDS